MSKRKRKTLPIRQGSAVVLATLGFFTLMGELGISSGGIAIYNFLKYPFGEMVWITPFIFFLLAVSVWVSALFTKKRKPTSKGAKSYQSTRAKQKPKMKTFHEELPKENFRDKGVEMPKGRLVSLKGFQDYFSTDLELKPMEPLAELDDLGKDFDTYFKEGKEISFKPIETRLTTVQGFSNYFDEVSSEIEEELRNTSNVPKSELSKTKLPFPSKREWDRPDLTTLASEHYPGQVAQLIKTEKRISQGVSPEERATLLGKSIHTSFRDSESSLEQGDLSSEQGDLQSSSEFMQGIAPSVKKRGESIVLEVEPLEVASDYHEDTMLQSEPSPEPSPHNELLMPPEDYPVDPLEGNQSKKLAEPEEKDIQPLKSFEPEKTSREWKVPSFQLLDPLPQVSMVHDQDTQKHLEQVLEDFGVHAKVIRVARGPVITRYELAPAPGVKISRIVNLADDIALGLAARDVRIEAPIPGKSAIGIEVPNKHPRAVPFREVLETPEFKEGAAKLRIALGKDIGNQSIVANLAKMPHLLVAGATGSGKSVCITAIINSLLFNTCPDEVKFLMVDPKMVELSIYNGIPHLLAPVVTDPKKAAAALKWVVKEMETRYELFAASGVRDIERYNQMKAHERNPEKVMEKGAQRVAPAMPWIVVIIDELADLMMVAADEVEESICRLAQMARAAGIHLVIATQRPSVDVITGVIKANIPSRISFAVSSQIDSRTILDSTGAEKLLGRGDMLYSPQGMNKPMRVQGCMVTDEEVQRVIVHWKSQGSPEYLDPEGFIGTNSSGKGESAGPDDELFVEAGHLIITTGMASVSYLQRKLKLGYARAARLIDLLEDNGVVGGYEGSKPRQILLTLEEFEERFG